MLGRAYNDCLKEQSINESSSKNHPSRVEIPTFEPRVDEEVDKILQNLLDKIDDSYNLLETVCDIYLVDQSDSSGSCRRRSLHANKYYKTCQEFPKHSRDTFDRIEEYLVKIEKEEDERSKHMKEPIKIDKDSFLKQLEKFEKICRNQPEPEDYHYYEHDLVMLHGQYTIFNILYQILHHLSLIRKGESRPDAKINYLLFSKATKENHTSPVLLRPFFEPWPKIKDKQVTTLQTNSNQQQVGNDLNNGRASSDIQNKKVDALNTRVNTISFDQAQFKSWKQQIEPEHVSMKNRIVSLESQIVIVLSKLEAISRSHEDSKEIRNRLTALEKEVVELKSTRNCDSIIQESIVVLYSIDDELKGIKGTLVEMEGRLEDHSTRFKRNSEIRDKERGSIHSCTKEQNYLKTDLAKLHKAVARIHESLGVTIDMDKVLDQADSNVHRLEETSEPESKRVKS